MESMGVVVGERDRFSLVVRVALLRMCGLRSRPQRRWGGNVADFLPMRPSTRTSVFVVLAFGLRWRSTSRFATRSTSGGSPFGYSLAILWQARATVERRHPFVEPGLAVRRGDALRRLPHTHHEPPPRRSLQAPYLHAKGARPRAANRYR